MGPSWDWYTTQGLKKRQRGPSPKETRFLKPQDGPSPPTGTMRLGALDRAPRSRHRDNKDHIVLSLKCLCHMAVPCLFPYQTANKDGSGARGKLLEGTFKGLLEGLWNLLFQKP